MKYTMATQQHRKYLILAALEQPLTLPEIGRLTRVNQAYVGKLTRELLSQGLLAKSGIHHSLTEKGKIILAINKGRLQKKTFSDKNLAT